jgi:hypothetical protein
MAMFAAPSALGRASVGAADEPCWWGDNERDLVTARRRRHRSESFSDIVDEAVEPGFLQLGEPMPWPNPLREGAWVDPEGEVWQRRGDRRTRIGAKRVRQLVRSADVRVRLFYGPFEERDIALSERDAFWQEIGPYYENRVAPAPGDMTSYDVGEFADTVGNKLLIVQKSC